MNAISTLSFSRYANVFADGLSIDNLRQNVPAVFADSAHESLSQKYTFIPTERVLTGLMSAGFVPVDARQAHSRKASPAHARHVVRLRRRFETVAAPGLGAGGRVPEQPRRHERLPAAVGDLPGRLHQWADRLRRSISGVLRRAPGQRRRSRS